MSSSSGVPPSERRPEQREVRIRGECPAEPGAGLDAVAEAPLDHAEMELLERVARAQTKRAPRVRERLVAAAVSGERPAEDVVSVDARPVVPRQAREREGLARADAVVGL